MVLTWRLGLPANVVSSIPEQDAEFLQGPWDTDWILCPREFPHPFHHSSLPRPTPPTTHFSRDNWKYTARNRNEEKVKELTLGCHQKGSANSTLSGD